MSIVTVSDSVELVFETGGMYYFDAETGLLR